MTRLLLLLPLLLLSLNASARIYVTNNRPVGVTVFLWKTNTGSPYPTTAQATNLPPLGTNAFTANDAWDGIGIQDTNLNFAAMTRLFPLKSGDVAIHSVGNGGCDLNYFFTNASAFRFTAMTNRWSTNTARNIHSYRYVTNKQFLLTSTAGDFGISNKTFTLNRNTFLWTNAYGSIGTNYAYNTNVLISYGVFTNYGAAFYWNGAWNYTDTDLQSKTGGWTNSNGYFVASDEDIAYGLGTLAQWASASTVGYDIEYKLIGAWGSPGGGAFSNRLDFNGVKITSTARGGNVIYSNAASITSSFVVATNVLATPAPTVSYQIVTNQLF